MNQNRNSISDLFCDTYVRISAQCSYILLPKLLTNKRLWEHPQFLLSPTGKAKCLEEFEGVPAYRIRHKYRKAIREIGDSPTGLYGILNQLFSESAIKDLFSVPNVWVLNHNALAKKKQATERNLLNRMKKKDPKGFQLHGECVARTQNMSVKKTARKIRGLQG